MTRFGTFSKQALFHNGSEQARSVLLVIGSMHVLDVSCMYTHSGWSTRNDRFCIKCKVSSARNRHAKWTSN